MVNCMANIEFQLSEFLAYPNTEIFGGGQRGSDNQGWTVCRKSFKVKEFLYAPNQPNYTIMLAWSYMPTCKYNICKACIAFLDHTIF